MRDMNTIKKLVRRYFNWWAGHYSSQSAMNLMLPSGMIPYNVAQLMYVKEDKNKKTENVKNENK